MLVGVGVISLEGTVNLEGIVSFEKMEFKREEGGRGCWNGRVEIEGVVMVDSGLFNRCHLLY